MYSFVHLLFAHVEFLFAPDILIYIDSGGAAWNYYEDIFCLVCGTLVNSNSSTVFTIIYGF